jgi:hypothetical protein
MICSSETSGCLQVLRRYIPEDYTLHGASVRAQHNYECIPFVLLDLAAFNGVFSGLG